MLIFLSLLSRGDPFSKDKTYNSLLNPHWLQHWGLLSLACWNAFPTLDLRLFPFPFVDYLPFYLIFRTKLPIRFILTHMPHSPMVPLLPHTHTTLPLKVLSSRPPMTSFWLNGVVNSQFPCLMSAFQCIFSLIYFTVVPGNPVLFCFPDFFIYASLTFWPLSCQAPSLGLSGAHLLY